MAHEEHTGMCSNGRLSKKLKNKKVPQRGMGVAQLEKIISEEHQKNDVAILAPNSTNFMLPPSPSMSIPLPPPLPPNHHRRLIQITDATNSVFVSKQMQSVINGGRLWIGGDYRYALENRNQNPNLNPSMLTNLSDSQRSRLFQQPCSSLMIELPSNQSYCSNNYYPPLKPHEEKMIGMKRPYPFSKENMPIPSFNFKFPFSASCSNGFREKSSNLVAKDFLTLAPPQIQSSTLPQHQGQTKDPSGSERSNDQPFYSFFPAAKNHGNNNGEEGEHVDLSLKL